MKITPKFLRGGGFDLFFTTYTPVEIQSQLGRSSQLSSRLTDRLEESTKGRLTEKDFFEMIKDIDGLPNEMNALVTNLMNTFQLDRMSGQSTGDLATKYLSNLYLIKTLALNKKKYDEAVATALKNGAMAEPAISMDGKLIVLNKENGSLNAISIDKYYKNRDDYAIITVSNLANMRAYSPSLARSLEAIDIINNSMGYEAFLELLSKSTLSLGSSENSRNGFFSVEGLASKGLELLLLLSNDDRVLALGSITAQGLYEYKIIDKSLLNLINALTSYITTLLPDRAKTWAAIKTGQSDKNLATKDLVFTYLLGRSNNSHSFDLTYKEQSNKSKSLSSSSGEDPKKGFWSLVLSGLGGDDFRFTILNKNGSMSIDGKFYGTTPGLDSNKSLGDYINNSGIGYIIKNNKNITFGDKKISTDSFNDVMVNAFSGAAAITLPIKVDGTVDLGIAERWVNVQNQMKNSGLDPNSSQYIEKYKLLLKDNQLEDLIDSNGNLNRNRFGHFIVLEGYTSEKANAVLDNKKISLKDILSDFIIPAGDDGELYDMIRLGLSSKERGEYDISGGLFNDELFKGNIYIPINTNLINGYNADLNLIKESTTYLYEKAQQQYSTNSNNL